MMMPRLLAVGAVAISLHASLHASIVSAAAPPSIPYEKYRLANGLDVILSQDRTLPLVAVDIWYHVGAANEEPGRTGFAHLFEHMMFTGSKHVARGMADKLLEGVGGTDSRAGVASALATLSRSGGHGGDSRRRPQNPRKQLAVAGPRVSRSVADYRNAVLSGAMSSQGSIVPRLSSGG